MREAARLCCVLAAAAAAYLCGLTWGLPSDARAAHILLPGQRVDSFYSALEANRRAMYERIGPNLQAAYGRGEWNGDIVASAGGGFELLKHRAYASPDPVLMHGFSSFLLRSVEQDEQFVINSIAHFRPRRLDFNPRTTLYGGAYLYPVAGLWAALHLAHALRLSTDPLFYYRNPSELARLYLAGRAFSAACALGCALVVWLLGAELYGARAGSYAAALFALSPAVVGYAHVMKPHLPGALLALTSLLWAARAVNRTNARDFWLSAVACGLAVGCAKYYWALCLPLAGAFLWARARGLSASWALLAGLSGASILAFLAANPYTFANWRDMADESRAMAGWYHSSLNPSAVLRLIGGPLRVGAGSWTWAAGLAGAALALRRRSFQDRLWWLLLAPLALATAFLFSSRIGDADSARFTLPMIALLCVSAAGALSQSGAAPTARLFLFALLLACDAVWTARADAHFRAVSNADSAADWIAAVAPPGSSIGLPTPAPMVDRFPPIAFSSYELDFFRGPIAGHERELPKRYVTRPDWALPQDVAPLYEVERTFDEPVLFGWKFQDPFTEANFPLVVMRKRT